MLIIFLSQQGCVSIRSNRSTVMLSRILSLFFDAESAIGMRYGEQENLVYNGRALRWNFWINGVLQWIIGATDNTDIGSPLLWSFCAPGVFYMVRHLNGFYIKHYEGSNLGRRASKSEFGALLRMNFLAENISSSWRCCCVNSLKAL